MNSSEETLIVLKPDAIERNLENKIIEFLVSGGFVCENIVRLQATSTQIRRLYPIDNAIELGKRMARHCSFTAQSFDDIGRDILKWNEQYMLRGQIMVMKATGVNIISRVRQVIGQTDCSQSRKNTIRGKFGVDCLIRAFNEKRANENLIHASDSVSNATNEINIWY